MSETKDPHLHGRCALPERYPEPKVQAPNHYYASLLLEDYTGAISEMTAINQYLYHHFTLHQHQELAELEECIAIIEMKHLELLAETIILLGVDPQFRAITNNLASFWSAAYVYYGTDVCDKLTADISSEIQAIEQYRRHRQMIDDPYIKVLLERIIKDEEHHRQLFSEVLAKYGPEADK